MTIAPLIRRTLAATSTATITTILFKHEVRNVWMRGARPVRADQPRVVGLAFTMRFIPAREDLANALAWTSPRSTRAAIEEIPPGSVVIADARGCADAGVLGDILCERMVRRGVAALITDGAVRDLPGVLETGLPVWCVGAAAPPAAAQLAFVGWQDPIGCGGVAVFPNEVIVADADGAVVIPASLLDAVVAQAPEQDRLEAWILAEVSKGASLPGLYPPNEANLARYASSTDGEDSE